MATRKPTTQTLAFGAEVARLRGGAGLSRLELARAVNVSRSYIAQVETGTTRCREDFATRLDSGLGTTPALRDAWDDLLRSAAYPTWFIDYPRAEATAALLRAFEVMVIYGLFQTESYARTLITSEAALKGRLRRQEMMRREPPPDFRIVLAETTLWTCIGGPQVMREQCEHLLALSEQKNVTLQVAPIGRHSDFGGPFNLATQPTGEELLYMSTAQGGVTSNDRQDILQVVSAFSALQAIALSADESREFLRKAIVRWS